MTIHEHTGLCSELTPPQTNGGGGSRNTVVRERAWNTTLDTYLYEGVHLRSLPDHNRDSNCRRANVMAIHEYTGLYSEVAPPQKLVRRDSRNTAVRKLARSTTHDMCLSEGTYIRSLLYLTVTRMKTAGRRMS